MANEKHERNNKMFEAVIRGGTWKSVADAGGVTTERARQVIHKMRRMMMHPKRLGSDVVPDHDYWQVAELRRCSDFWLAQLVKWKTEHGSNTKSEINGVETMNSYGDGNTYRGTVCKDSEVPTIITDGKTAYSGKDYPVHTNGPWEADATHCRTVINSKALANSPRKHIAMVNITKNPEYEITKEEHEANAKLIAAAPEMLEVLRWMDNEMDCRDDEYGGVLFSRGDFEKVRRAIKLAMEG